MKQIRYVEETNGQITPNFSGIRYERRELYEDRVKYVPTFKEPKVYTMVLNYNGDVRRRGKWDEARVLGEYPGAVGFSYHDVNTNKEIKLFKLNNSQVKKGNLRNF